jgi:hypothetical protein
LSGWRVMRQERRGDKVEKEEEDEEETTAIL